MKERVQQSQSLEPVAETLPPQRTWGVGVGRKRGSRNRISAEMWQQVEQYLEIHGESANFLIALAEIFRDPENSASVRTKAAEAFGKFVTPRLLQIDKTDDDEESGNGQLIITALTSLLSPSPDVKSLPVAENRGDR
jgi:hypothetical protein